MTNFSAILYIDLDALVVDDITEVLKCGSFCAVMRHSDLFNFGVFVLQPNLKVNF